MKIKKERYYYISDSYWETFKFYNIDYISVEKYNKARRFKLIEKFGDFYKFILKSE